MKFEVEFRLTIQFYLLLLHMKVRRQLAMDWVQVDLLAMDWVQVDLLPSFRDP